MYINGFLNKALCSSAVVVGWRAGRPPRHGCVSGGDPGVCAGVQHLSLKGVSSPLPAPGEAQPWLSQQGPPELLLPLRGVTPSSFPRFLPPLWAFSPWGSDPVPVPAAPGLLSGDVRDRGGGPGDSVGASSASGRGRGRRGVAAVTQGDLAVLLPPAPVLPSAGLRENKAGPDQLSGGGCDAVVRGCWGWRPWDSGLGAAAAQEPP